MAGILPATLRIRHARAALAAGALTLSLGLVGCTGPGATAPAGPAPDPELTATPTAEPTAEADAGAPVDTEAPVETEAAVEPTETPADTLREVTVAVIGIEYLGSDGGVEVRSFVAEYIGEGTCTYIATDAEGEEHRTEVAALPDAQSTVCPTTYLEDLAPGGYDVVVEFANDEVRGASEPVGVEVDA